MAKKDPNKVDGRSKAARAAKAAAQTAGKGGNGRALSAKDNGEEEARRLIFLQHRRLWTSANDALDAAKEKLKGVVKHAKDDGFSKRQFQIADALVAGDKSEFKIRTETHDRLQVAKWIGHSFGKKVNLNQLDLFGDTKTPDGSPVDSAYDAGKQAGLEGAKAEVPGQFSGSELSQAWLSGWHLGQETLAKGINPLEFKPGDPPAL